MSAPQATSPTPSVDRLIGQVLNDTYAIDRLIAAGGMGAVYEGRHLRLNRRVAIKVLLDHRGASPKFVDRFRREAEILGQIEHPHVVQVLDVDDTKEGFPFFVMEYLEGETLRERLRARGPLPILEAVRIVSDAAAALAQVHSQGVVHCDLKPTNVFLVKVKGQPDFVKMLDFGVSTVTEPEVRRERDVEILGTPNYMAPEQALGRRELDHRVDQFALAAIAYELLSGRKAFGGEDTESILEHVKHSEPAALSEVAPWVPSLVEGVLRRALSKNPKDRYPSVSTFAWALGNALIDAGIDQSQHATPDGRYAIRPGTADEVHAARSPRPPRSSEPPTSVQGRGSGAMPAASAGNGGAPDPNALLVEARRLWHAGHLDDAVAKAEELLELAVSDRAPGVLKVLATGVPTLDAIFEARVGSDERKLVQGPAADQLRYTLSPRAAQLVARVDEPTTVSGLLSGSGISRRDGMRLVAGLLRRRVLVAA